MLEVEKNYQKNKCELIKQLAISTKYDARN